MTEKTDRAPYVNLYPSDWMGGCATLPALAEWVYHQVCLHNWDKGEPVPEKRFAMIFMRHPGGTDGWQADLDLLIDLGKLIKTQSGSVFATRALAEANKAQMALDKRKRGGKKGAEKRWGNNDLDRSPIASPSENDGIPYGNQNQNQNQNQREDKSSPPYSPPGDLIFEIDPETWDAFVEHRLKGKSPLTERAGKMIKNELVKLYEENGHDPNAVLRQSIMRGWKGVFPLADDQRNGKSSGWRMPGE